MKWTGEKVETFNMKWTGEKVETLPSRDKLTEAFNRLEDELMIKVSHETNDEKRALYLAHSIIIAANFKALNDALKIIENKR